MRSKTQDTVRFLQIAAWMWVGYLLALMIIDAYMYANAPRTMLRGYYLSNGMIALIFMGFSYWSGFQRILKGYFVPFMLLIISSLPIATGRFLMAPLPPGPMSNIEGITLRMLPILFIALMLTAWQYSWRHVILFALGTAGLEIAILQVMPSPANPSAAHAVLFVAIVRSVSFLVVGYFVNRLMHRLRTQQEKLAQANAQLAHYASTLENLTISRERNRMARELHDTLAHTLSGLAVQLETAKACWDVKPATTYELLDQSLQTTRSGLQETRRALKALRASPLDDLGLKLAIQKLAENAANRARVNLDLLLPDQMPSLPPDVEQCLYRIAQEAVENVVNHANARNLAVKLAFRDNDISLTIQDDGQGIRMGDDEKSNHFGLPGMRERAQLVGGELKIESKPGQGTTVQIIIQGKSHESDHL